MSKVPEKSEPRKIVTLSRDLVERIADFRYANRIPTEAAAIRILIERGLATALTPEMTSPD